MQRQTMTVKETAEYMGVSADMLYDMVRKKEIPHVRVRRRILFYQETVDAWMQNQETMKPVS